MTRRITSIFQQSNLLQILSTLLESGFTAEILGKTNLDRVTIYLEKHLQDQEGLLGFGQSQTNHTVDAELMKSR